MTSTPERVVLEEDGITVTTTRIQASGGQYPGFVIPLATVACVYEVGAGAGARARRSAEAWALALLLLALYMVLGHQYESAAPWMVGIAALFFVLSRPTSPVWKSLNARRTVIEVRDASGEVHVLHPRHFGAGLRIYRAIQEAIVESRSFG